MTDETKTIPYVPPPQACGACINKLLDTATANPDRALESVYCPHAGGALLTANLTDYQEKRVIYAWHLSGPMTPEQAIEAQQANAQQIGAKPVIDYGKLQN